MSWQKARAMTQEIYACSKTGPFARDFGLKDQIQRSAVSTMANIAEGFERGGDNEFAQFLSTAKGSCGEVRSHLYVAFDQSYISAEAFTQLHDRCTEVSRLIAGFMGYLRESNLRGHKYR